MENPNPTMSVSSNSCNTEKDINSKSEREQAVGVEEKEEEGRSTVPSSSSSSSSLIKLDPSSHTSTSTTVEEEEEEEEEQDEDDNVEEQEQEEEKAWSQSQQQQQQLQQPQRSSSVQSTFSWRPNDIVMSKSNTKANTNTNRNRKPKTTSFLSQSLHGHQPQRYSGYGGKPDDFIGSPSPLSNNQRRSWRPKNNNNNNSNKKISTGTSTSTVPLSVPTTRKERWQYKSHNNNKYNDQQSNNNTDISISSSSNSGNSNYNSNNNIIERTTPKGTTTTSTSTTQANSFFQLPAPPLNSPQSTPQTYRKPYEVLSAKPVLSTSASSSPSVSKTVATASVSIAPTAPPTICLDEEDDDDDDNLNNNDNHNDKKKSTSTTTTTATTTTTTIQTPTVTPNTARKIWNRPSLVDASKLPPAFQVSFPSTALLSPKPPIIQSKGKVSQLLLPQPQPSSTSLSLSPSSYVYSSPTTVQKRILMSMSNQNDTKMKTVMVSQSQMQMEDTSDTGTGTGTGTGMDIPTTTTTTTTTANRNLSSSSSNMKTMITVGKLKRRWPPIVAKTTAAAKAKTKANVTTTTATASSSSSLPLLQSTTTTTTTVNEDYKDTSTSPHGNIRDASVLSQLSPGTIRRLSVRYESGMNHGRTSTNTNTNANTSSSLTSSSSSQQQKVGHSIRTIIRNAAREIALEQQQQQQQQQQPSLIQRRISSLSMTSVTNQHSKEFQQVQQQLLHTQRKDSNSTSNTSPSIVVDDIIQQEQRQRQRLQEIVNNPLLLRGLWEAYKEKEDIKQKIDENGKNTSTDGSSSGCHRNTATSTSSTQQKTATTTSDTLCTSTLSLSTAASASTSASAPELALEEPSESSCNKNQETQEDDFWSQHPIFHDLPPVERTKLVKDVNDILKDEILLEAIWIASGLIVPKSSCYDDGDGDDEDEDWSCHGRMFIDDPFRDNPDVDTNIQEENKTNVGNDEKTSNILVSSAAEFDEFCNKTEKNRVNTSMKIRYSGKMFQNTQGKPLLFEGSYTDDDGNKLPLAPLLEEHFGKMETATPSELLVEGRINDDHQEATNLLPTVWVARWCYSGNNDTDINNIDDEDIAEMWIVKRVWDDPIIDSTETEYFMKRDELMDKVKELLGLPSKTNATFGGDTTNESANSAASPLVSHADSLGQGTNTNTALIVQGEFAVFEGEDGYNSEEEEWCVRKVYDIDGEIQGVSRPLDNINEETVAMCLSHVADLSRESEEGLLDDERASSMSSPPPSPSPSPSVLKSKEGMEEPTSSPTSPSITRPSKQAQPIMNAPTNFEEIESRKPTSSLGIGTKSADVVYKSRKVRRRQNRLSDWTDAIERAASPRNRSTSFSKQSLKAISTMKINDGEKEDKEEKEKKKKQKKDKKKKKKKAEDNSSIWDLLSYPTSHLLMDKEAGKLL